ncbi:hypothetical protein ACL02U_09795 [Streptomyces sp. MS06]|uniref:hypothetical protein n=1 Tax=Streptomyces sp. MS06 TaxID=3385974 RepID=UPI0039A34675
MKARLVSTAADVICRAMANGRQTPAGIACDLESAQLLQSPETAAEHEQVRAKFAEAAAEVARLVMERGERMKVENAVREELREARARVAELEAERHSTNEALDDAVQALRAAQARLAAYERPADTGAGALATVRRLLLVHYAGDPNPALTVGVLLRNALAEQPGTVFRAQHDSIVMGLYTTAAEARAHCVAEERRTWAAGAAPVFDWIEDEEDGVAELVTVTEDGETETVTGYVVTALEVASAYDEGADQ